VWDPAWTELDGQGVAHLLARAVAVLGGADLILCGRQASDLEQGLVGPMLAEELGMPCVTVGRRITVQGQSVRVEREVDGLVESVEVTLPAVVTMTSAKSNVPRMPKVKDVMLARGKLIRVLGAAELGVEPGWVGARVRVERLRVPVTAGRCEMLAGEEAGAQAAALVDRLRALKVI
ncbi:MAG: electron transfer flavoprotein subunit beta/FixA family protein, partial [Gemmatimonadetes bacterium]|nr:electron transfer flavoprotein subunit beta/FixA family protein [Gemmatimonadota bacterium]